MPKKPKSEPVTKPEEPPEPQTPLVKKDSISPDPIGDFSELMMKYGVNENRSQTIAQHIVNTGSADVLFKPLELMEKLNKFPMWINPTMRKLILDDWMSINKLPIPEGYEEKAGKSKEEIEMAKKDELDEQRRHEEKYSVDITTGVIKVADSSDKTALSWSEAEKLSKRIKDDLAVQQKRDKKETGEESDSLPFTYDAEGNITMVPGTRLSARDTLYLQAINKSREKGETRTPSEIIEAEVAHLDRMDQLRGKGKESGGLLDDVDKLVRLKDAFGPGKELQGVLTEISTKLDKVGKPGEATPEMETLRTQIGELTKRLDDQEKQALRDQIASQNAKIEALGAALKKQGETQTANNEFGIMSKVVDKIDGAGKDLKDTVLTLLAKPAPPMAETERAAITEAIGTEATKVSAKQELGAKIFTPPGKGA